MNLLSTFSPTLVSMSESQSRVLDNAELTSKKPVCDVAHHHHHHHHHGMMTTKFEMTSREENENEHEHEHHEDISMTNESGTTPKDNKRCAT